MSSMRSPRARLSSSGLRAWKSSAVGWLVNYLRYNSPARPACCHCCRGTRRPALGGALTHDDEKVARAHALGRGPGRHGGLSYCCCYCYCGGGLLVGGQKAGRGWPGQDRTLRLEVGDYLPTARSVTCHDALRDSSDVAPQLAALGFPGNGETAKLGLGAVGGRLSTEVVGIVALGSWSCSVQRAGGR
jgi:hypothetical protein